MDSFSHDKKEEKSSIYFTPRHHSTIIIEKPFNAPRKNVKLYSASETESQHIHKVIKTYFSFKTFSRFQTTANNLRKISQQDLTGLDCDFLPSSPPQRQMSSSDESMPELSTPTPPVFNPKPYKPPKPIDFDQLRTKLEEFKVTADEKEPSRKRFRQSHSPIGLDLTKHESSTASSSTTPDSLKNPGLISIGSDWVDTDSSCPDLVSLTDPSDNDKGKTPPKPKPRLQIPTSR